MASSEGGSKATVDRHGFEVPVESMGFLDAILKLLASVKKIFDDHCILSLVARTSY